MDKLASALHDATHLVPGVPAHSEVPHPHGANPAGGASPRQRNRPHHNSNRRHQAPPRVLIAWQNWIGRLVGRDANG
jgi:hypothetical protein